MFVDLLGKVNLTRLDWNVWALIHHKIEPFNSEAGPY